jgi:hypothetical protein
LIGEIIGEFKGKPTGTRILADGKMEVSSTGLGSILGKEASIMSTGVYTLMPNGVMMLELHGMVMTAEGEIVMIKSNGIGWSTGKGLKSSARGATYFMNSSPKLASLNKTVAVYELETNEQGEFSHKSWAWK